MKLKSCKWLGLFTQTPASSPTTIENLLQKIPDLPLNYHVMPEPLRAAASEIRYYVVICYAPVYFSKYM